jgi:chromosomal replication initiation ATPase DnaA|tara:strand:- start:461 stop:769 length:309 start_codon:yes stop_codon:yes gene_type:complete
MKGAINLATPIAIIVDRVAYEYSLTVEELTGRRRPDHVMWPRHLAMNLCYEAGHTYRTICDFFDRKYNALTYVNKEVTRMCAEMPDLQKHRIRLARELGINV